MQEILDNALEPVDWINHLENDLMKFWNKSGAKDMSDGLFPTYLSAKGEKLSDLEELPEEIKAALECDDTKGIIDLENNYDSFIVKYMNNDPSLEQDLHSMNNQTKVSFMKQLSWLQLPILEQFISSLFSNEKNCTLFLRCCFSQFYTKNDNLTRKNDNLTRNIFYKIVVVFVKISSCEESQKNDI